MSEKILVADDEPSNRKILAQELVHQGFAVDTVAGGKEALAKMDSTRPDLLILDYMMPDLSGLDVLKELRKNGNETPVIMITAYGSVERAVESMKAGAYDFITRPFEPDHIAIVIQRALERQRLKRDVEVLSDEAGQRYRLVVGESPKMRQAVELARKAADSRSTVLLLGESGTGKEIFARNIHSWSGRNNEPFIAINCVGMSKELLESELFGHEQGAFTGASKQKRGKLELAHRGTVFFDEIGDISLELQAKLLRFLQEREFERVGGVAPISVDVRVLAATNRNLEAALKAGAFREDLYHRLNVIPLRLPALRERKEDIPALARYFWQKTSVESGKSIGAIPERMFERLMEYHWPGNVRELANAIERTVVLGGDAAIAPEILLSDTASSDGDPFSYREAIERARKETVTKALAKTQGNRAAAAKLLGLEAKYFLKLMKSLQIE